MAFTGSTFARVSAHNNSDCPHVWAYRHATDDVGAALGANYFDEKNLELSIGDIIECHMLVSGTDEWAVLVVTNIASGVVTVASRTLTTS